MSINEIIKYNYVVFNINEQSIFRHIVIPLHNILSNIVDIYYGVGPNITYPRK